MSDHNSDNKNISEKIVKYEEYSKLFEKYDQCNENIFWRRLTPVYNNDDKFIGFKKYIKKKNI